MNRRVFACILSLILFTFPLAAETPRGSITIDRIAAIKHPSDATWSPDGRMIAFVWDDAGNQNLHVVKPGERPIALTSFPPNPDTLTGDINRFAWIAAETILFIRDGKLWTAGLTAQPAQVPRIEGVEDFALAPDKKQMVFLRNGQLLAASIDGKAQRQLLRLEDPLRAAAPVFSPDGRHVAFTVSHIERMVDVLPYNGSKLGLFRNAVSDRRVGILSVDRGEPVWIAIDGTPNYVQWIDAESILFQRVSPDMKTREILVASFGGKTRRLWKDTDPRWWSPIGRDARTAVSPDGKQVAFFTDRTGWTHLYVIPTNAASASEARQLTSGEFETGFGSWSPDSKRIAFYHSQGSLMERFIWVVDIESGKVEPIINAPGVSYWPRFASDGRSLVYEHTDVENSVDLYVTPVKPRATPLRLTYSMPEEIKKSDLTAPVPVYFPSRVDGKRVPATLFVPKNLDRSQRHPAIVWIHGSGSDQNFIGWHPLSYRMYYSVHQYLVQQGYVVLAVDYRGSSGYGREWGTGHYWDLGGKDYLDVASGADYLKTLGYVDPDRVGVWGLSYGGFMTLQAATVTPTLFRCAIDVAGVSDWATWGMESSGGWIRGRMGTPAENPDGFYRSASIKHMDAVVRPLLILHGTADVNVAFRESLNLIDVLAKKGKDFDFVVYPGEIHFFRRAHILRDAWSRVEQFFDAHLKNGKKLISQ